MRAVAFVLVVLAGCAKEPLQGASGRLPINRAVWAANTSTRQVREVAVPDEVVAILNAPDRLASDRVLDERGRAVSFSRSLRWTGTGSLTPRRRSSGRPDSSSRS